jgi:hypothetical protein
VPRVAAWIEIAFAVVLVIGAIHPFSDWCTGRALGLDCESRAILAVNVLVPLGLLIAACGAWFLKTGSVKSQYTLVLGAAAMLAYWLSFTL